MNIAVVGIDLGSDNSLIGIAKKGGIHIATNEFSNRKTPSMVAYTDKKRVVGSNAAFARPKNWQNTIYLIKDLLSAPKSAISRLHPLFQTTSFQDGSLGIKVTQNGSEMALRVESVAAVLFGSLRDSAARFSQASVGDCFLSAPASAPICKRQSLIAAARVAGLNVSGLFSEQAAVALSYGIPKDFGKERRLVLFVDVGHSATKLGLVAFEGRSLKVLRTAESAAVCGRVFDDILMGMAASLAREKFGVDVTANRRAFVRLEKAVRKAKEVLSVNDEAGVYVECFTEDIDLSLVLKRKEFELQLVKAIDELISIAVKTISGGNVAKDALHSIEIIGGSSRVPSLQKALESFFGKTLSMTCDADESIANGCSFRCALKSPLFRVKEFKVADCFPHAIEIAWGKVSNDFNSENCEFEHKSIMFDEFCSLPSARLVSFRKEEPFQVVIRYAYPEKLPSGTNPFILRFVVRPPRAEKREGYDRKVSAKIVLDPNGLVVVRGVDLLEEVDAPQPTIDSNEPAGKEPKNDPKKEEKTEEKGDEKTEQKDEEKVKTEVKKPKIKKRKTVKTPLLFDQTVGWIGEEVISEAIALEKKMSDFDRKIDEVCELKNELEQIVIEARPKVTGEWKECAAEKEASDLLGVLDEIEEYIYTEQSDDPANISQLQSSISSLKSKCSAISRRTNEFRNFPRCSLDFQDAIKSGAALYKEATRGSERFLHLKKEEIATSDEALRSAAIWLERVVRQRHECPQTRDFETENAEVLRKAEELRAVTRRVYERPKPKEAEKTKNSEKPKEELKKENSPPPKEGEAEKVNQTESIPTGKVHKSAPEEVQY